MHHPPELLIRVGCRLRYQTPSAVPALFKLKPRIGPDQFIRQERMSFAGDTPCEESEDGYGNLMHRLMLPAGQAEILHDAIVAVPALADRHDSADEPPVPPLDLPASLLRFTLPSRYCDSDKLLEFAWRQFGGIRGGHAQVQAICDWLHERIEYRFGAGRSDTSASDVIGQGFGVCRDFAHSGIALCRALNLPARYVTGHLPDVGYVDPGSPMDFHAYFEVYLGGRWFAYDPRYNVPRIGRIAIARGLDAVDGAFATIYGPAQLNFFDVWAYQVARDTVAVGDPIDLGRRLDGQPEVRLG
jgi:transglutaminase-like putative cysteine protease